MWHLLKLKRFWFGLIIVVMIGSLASCSSVRLIMQQAPLKAKALPNLPALQSRAEMLTGLEENVYGKIPKLTDVTILSKKEIARDAFESDDVVTEWAVKAGYGGATQVFHIVFIKQAHALNAPMIITQNFCPNTAVVPIEGVTPPSGDYFDCSGGGVMGHIFGYFFGRYITVPPYKMILKHGYNMAVFYPPEFVPDSSARAPAVLDALFAKTPENRPGALAVWSSLSVWLAETLKAEGDIKTAITYGHSRYGKTALISAADTQAIDGVIAHQSGTGGASIMRDDTGESIAQVVENYPHWFTPKFTEYAEDKSALPVDSNELLALIAPRPVLLGNARRDVWSDPLGAFNAARIASPAWNENGSEGLTATRLDDFKPQDNLAFWMRPGTHGVVREDWPAFLEFLDAHFK